jgi:hypothetical protein
MLLEESSLDLNIFHRSCRINRAVLSLLPRKMLIVGTARV